MASWTSKLGSRYPRELIDKLDAEHHRTLQQLRKQPANAVCAECGEGDTCWASVNLGVFLCIRCSDVHRALGTHITKVKGCSGTYLWGPDEIEQMKQIGNAKAAERYGGATAQSEPSATKERRLELCKSKYENGSMYAASKSLKPVVSKSKVAVPTPQLSTPLVQRQHRQPEAIRAPQQQQAKQESADLIGLEDHAFWQGFGMSEKVDAVRSEPPFPTLLAAAEADRMGFDDLLGPQQLPQTCAAAAGSRAPPPASSLERDSSASFWAECGEMASW